MPAQSDDDPGARFAELGSPAISPPAREGAEESAANLAHANQLRSSLVSLMEHLHRNLAAEQSPREFKSVRKQCTDLKRALPHWQDHVPRSLNEQDASKLLLREKYAVEFLLEAAVTTLQDLSELDPAGMLKTDPRAQTECSNLMRLVGSALGYINEEFQEFPPSSHSLRAIRSSEASV